MIHNDYAAPSGEEVQFYNIARLLTQRGHQVQLYTRSSAEIFHMRLGKLRAFCAGIYNPNSRRRLSEVICKWNPQIIFIGNLFPLISAAVLPVCKGAGVPVVMRVPNYRFMCPIGLHLSRGEVCERCINGKEYWCLLKNCKEDPFVSMGYALRSMVSRKAGLFKNNVSAYICASQFMYQKMIDAGFEAQRLHIIPNLVPDPISSGETLTTANGCYVGYVGRISEEKGIHVLFEAARGCPDIPFRLAGRMSSAFHLSEPIPENVELSGFLKGQDLFDFYSQAKFIVAPSVCFETFCMSIAEAMLHSKPVVASRIGVIPEFVEEGITGLMAEPGNIQDVSSKIRYLWEHQVHCLKMGQAARHRALHEYSPDMYYNRLMSICS
jgi:glycosyltransferase involved in cell wall biosynthesis